MVAPIRIAPTVSPTITPIRPVLRVRAL